MLYSLVNISRKPVQFCVLFVLFFNSDIWFGRVNSASKCADLEFANVCECQAYQSPSMLTQTLACVPPLDVLKQKQAIK